MTEYGWGAFKLLGPSAHRVEQAQSPRTTPAFKAGLPLVDVGSETDWSYLSQVGFESPPRGRIKAHPIG